MKFKLGAAGMLSTGQGQIVYPRLSYKRRSVCEGAAACTD